MRILPAGIVAVALAAATLHAADKKKDDPSQIGNRKIGNCVNIYSIEKEIALGKQLAEEVKRQAKLNDDPIISEYVNRVGQNLVRNSDAKVPFTFQVVEDEAPNAFALPGGFVFVYTGLLKIADEEDEFAGAVAHEIAHVAARHMTCQATKSTIANIATIPLSVILGGWTGYGVRQAAGVAIPMTFLKFGRSDEAEADYLGVQYMYAAGYDPNGAVSMFEKLDALLKKRPGLLDKVFSTHPMDSDRIQNTQKEIARILPSKPEYVVSTSEYGAVRDRLIALESRRKGDAKDGRPVLRVKPGAGAPTDDDSKTDDRPTIKRRDLVE
ncbi:MAG TPA: M48 family metallopeptidase [Bryobacteraceae bacterium]|jgi:predicted Zn-dependent protease